MIEVPRRSAGRATIVAAVAIVALAVIAVLVIGRPEMFASSGVAPTEASRESVQQAAAPETRPGEIGSPTLNAPADETGPDSPGQGEEPVAEGDDSGLVPLGSVIPVPPDFAAIFERNGDLANFHRRLESEPENAEWARRIEDILQNMFLSKLDPSAYVVSTLECRATACEILAMGYGDDALRNWMAAIAGLEDSGQDFGELFGGPGNFGCGAGNVAPGIYALNCTLQRVDPPPEGAEPAETFSLSAPYEDGITVEPVVVADAAVDAIESSADLYKLHRQLEREATDYGWSNYIEPLLAEYVRSLGAESGMSLLGVTCRTTLCEVQMLATNDQAMMMWVPSMLEFQQLDWHDLGIAGLDTSDVPDGEPTGVVWILQRRPPQ